MPAALGIGLVGTTADFVSWRKPNPLSYRVRIRENLRNQAPIGEVRLIECRDRFGAGDLAARGAAWREGQVWVDLAQDGSTISPPLLTSATIRSGCARYRLRLRSSPTPSARNVLRGLTSERLRQRGGP